MPSSLPACVRRSPLPWLLLVLISLGSTFAARAQAPEQLHSVVLRVHRVGIGVPVITDTAIVLDVDGTFGEVFHQTSITPGARPPQRGTYAYERGTATTASLALSYEGQGSPTPFSLTFVTPTTGTLTGSSSAGTFHVTPIPLAGPLVNTSQRGLVNDTTPAIIGFVVPPEQTTLVLVRAIGPGLAPFNVASHVIDPRIAVYRENTLIAENDDWDDEPGMKATIIELNGLTGAFPISDGSKDAALALLLPAGNYTVQVRGAPGETMGEILGEIYAVP